MALLPAGQFALQAASVVHCSSCRAARLSTKAGSLMALACAGAEGCSQAVPQAPAWQVHEPMNPSTVPLDLMLHLTHGLTMSSGYYLVKKLICPPS
jgi:hypothetical protein